MLERKSKKLLNELRKTTQGDCYIQGGSFDSMFSSKRSDLANKLHMTDREFWACVDYLIAEGFVRYVDVGSAKKCGIKLTGKGELHRGIRRTEKWANFRHWFLYPCLVALATSFLSTPIWPTLWRWLEAALGWFQGLFQ